MTLRELSIRLKGAAWRREYQSKADVRVAWWMSMLSRQKEIPKLETLMGETSRPPEHKAKLQRAAWVDWAIAHGYQIVRHEKPVI